MNDWEVALRYLPVIKHVSLLDRILGGIVEQFGRLRNCSRDLLCSRPSVAEMSDSGLRAGYVIDGGSGVKVFRIRFPDFHKVAHIFHDHYDAITKS